MKQIKFTRYGSNTVAGNFAPGELLRCSDDMARHLVQAVRCAEYMDAASPPPGPTDLARPVRGAAPAFTTSQPTPGPRPARRSKPPTTGVIQT